MKAAIKAEVVKFSKTLPLLLLIACSGPQVAINPRADFTKIKRVAVATFSGTKGDTAADFLTHSLLKSGADVVERQRLDALLKELQWGGTGILEENTAKKLGKILGVDAIFTGSVTTYSPAQGYLVFNPNTDKTTIITDPVTPLAGTSVFPQGRAIGVSGADIITSAASVGLTARMVDVETGTVLWSAHNSYEGFDMDSAMEAVTSSFVKSLEPVWLKPKP